MGVDASQAPGVDPAIAQELREQRARQDYLLNSVQQMGGYLQSEAQQRAEAMRQAEEARINALPPQDQANERVKLVQRENQELRAWITRAAQGQQQQQRQAAPQVQDRQSVPMTPEQIAAAKQALVDKANAEHGLSGEQAITLADVPKVYHDSQDRFEAKLAELGESRKGTSAAEADDMAKKRQAGSAAPSGASRPMSPQPNAPKRDVDKADFSQVLGREHRAMGDKVIPPSQRRAQLQDLRDEAAARLQR